MFLGSNEAELHFLDTNLSSFDFGSCILGQTYYLGLYLSIYKCLFIVRRELRHNSSKIEVSLNSRSK